MALAVMLFGLNVAPLLDAIETVESERGRTSDNLYQIEQVYLDDLTRIYNRIYAQSIVFDREASRRAILDYWKFYGDRYSKKTGNPVTLEVLARIHNGGPNGAQMYATKRYWRKVKAELGKEEMT